MHRRRVLALVATAPLLAGCNSASTTGEDSLLGERERPSPSDLQTATRPPATEPPDPMEDTVSPLSYPDRPTSYTTESVAAFVEEYERAYRRNGLLADHGRSLIAQMSAFHWTHTLAADDDAGVGRAQYAYSESVEQADGVVVGDSPILAVTYYVDDSVVVRAQDTGERENRDVLEPDPWETGVVLEPTESEDD